MKRKDDRMQPEGFSYRKLFLSCVYISSLTFGGGYVMAPLMKKRFVDQLEWLDEEEMLNFIAIAQSTPGAMAVNTTTLLGHHLGGFLGAAIAVLGTTLPPFCIILTISVFYEQMKSNPYASAILKGMQACVAAMIIDAVLLLGSSVVKQKNLLSILIMVTVFVADYIFGINIMLLLACAAVIGVTSALIGSWKNHRQKEEGKETAKK